MSDYIANDRHPLKHNIVNVETATNFKYRSPNWATFSNLFIALYRAGILFQLHCLQYLIHEIVTGGSPKKAGGFFSAHDTEVPSNELRLLENFFNRLAFFPHVIDYRGNKVVYSESSKIPGH
jgi:hypothetical protein